MSTASRSFVFDGAFPWAHDVNPSVRTDWVKIGGWDDFADAGRFFWNLESFDLAYSASFSGYDPGNGDDWSSDQSFSRTIAGAATFAAETIAVEPYLRGLVTDKLSPLRFDGVNWVSGGGDVEDDHTAILRLGHWYEQDTPSDDWGFWLSFDYALQGYIVDDGMDETPTNGGNLIRLTTDASADEGESSLGTVACSIFGKSVNLNLYSTIGTGMAALTIDAPVFWTY